MMSDDDSCIVFVGTCMVNVVFSYFLLSPHRRMVVLTCARFIQGSELPS